MTLEEFSKTCAVRWPLAACAFLLRVISRVNPRFPCQLAKKTRALLSTRINSILHEQLFVGLVGSSGVCLAPGFLFCNTALDVNLTLDVSDYTQGNIYFNGLPGFFLDLISFTDREAAFFDLGANMGLVSVAMAQFINQKNIVAVEALPDSYGRLRGAFDKNCPEAVALNVALSSTVTDLDFCIPSSDSGSASASIPADDIAAQRFRNTRTETLRVKARPFDDIFQQVDSGGRFSSLTKHAFKIDVEGHEGEVLKGMAKYFENYSGEIFIVVEVRERTEALVENLLLGHGFLRAGHDPLRRQETSLNDLIYRRDSASVRGSC